VRWIMTKHLYVRIQARYDACARRPITDLQ
jgi:hypothetical protein